MFLSLIKLQVYLYLFILSLLRIPCILSYMTKPETEVETISVSTFRDRLFKLFRAVKSGEKSLVVTYYGEPIFTVTQCDEDYICKHQFRVSEVRSFVADFQDELMVAEFILITRRGKKILCTRV